MKGAQSAFFYATDLWQKQSKGFVSEGEEGKYFGNDKNAFTKGRSRLFVEK